MYIIPYILKLCCASLPDAPTLAPIENVILLRTFGVLLVYRAI